MGFIRDHDEEVHAVIQCSDQPLPWKLVEDKFIVKFEMCSDAGKEQVVPLSALVHPVCVVPNNGSNDADDYMLILPKGQWSDYFGREVQRHRNNQATT